MQNKPSRLELYLKIIESIAKKPSLELTRLQEDTNFERSLLEKAMLFLEQRALVRKVNTQKEILYTNTPKGYRIAKYLSGQKVDQTDQFSNQTIKSDLKKETIPTIDTSQFKIEQNIPFFN